MHRLSPLLIFTMSLAASASGEVTYSKEISRIVQDKCQLCHRPNDITPFALMTYQDVVTYAEDIRQAVSQRIMPPWKPVAGLGEFRDSYALSDEDRRTLLDWIAAGMPQGDPADLPEPSPAGESPWMLGEPDLVLSMPEYTPPRAADTYRCFVLPTGFEETRYVSASQASPGDKQSVHHVLLFIDTSGRAEQLDGQDGQPGYNCFGGPGPGVAMDLGGMLGAWAPGLRTRRLPEGIALLVPARAAIVMQVHYHRSGRIAPDRTQVGLWFASRESVNKRLVVLPLANTGFRIPAGARDYEVIARQVILPFMQGKVILVGPHMHLLGKRIKLEIEERDGTRRPLIYIDDWDFRWQNFYTFVEPVPILSGSVLKLSAVYDNSEMNPRNPNNPLRDVRWGEATDDEMCLAFIGVVFDFENLLPAGAARKSEN